ncbi:MAG: class E sortase [Acidimicrobiia bacterium]
MREAIGFIGRALITIGLLLLGFVAYQLWGTDLFTSREQDSLKAQFEKQLAATTTTAGGGSASTTAPAAPPETVPGDALGIIKIPKIGVDQVVINGTTRDDLRKGPGHYPETPLPGQLGNSAIAGHRTTYGAPFFDLDQLGAGDQIIVQTVTGKYTYAVRETGVVNPNQVEIVANTPGSAQLTLTTCNPKYSAAERLFVKAGLVPDISSPPIPLSEPGQQATPKPQVAAANKEGLSGEPGEANAAILWGLAVAAVGAIWWFWFHRYHRWWTWLVGAIPFLAVLFVFYFHVERALPANF